jgi:hypothetical protein
MSAVFTQTLNDVGGTITFFGPMLELELAIGCVDGAVSATFVNNHRFNGSITSDTVFTFSADTGGLTMTGTFTDTAMAPGSCLGATGQFAMTMDPMATAISMEIENRRTIHWWVLDGSDALPADKRAGKIVLER